ncbi:hypothetical protein JK628_16090 [Shewanella sp. KX20019]|uniref:hypothetical protein n=1 Tax=Shewanella sp. KX20019 TaxID=2803864 RepID=UPI0019254BFF|nr:hypothetical protein [Shewanella sp. KX20019]QQX79067.1 hypothetical protein JK628_16090 [Shewanella sp. KX20019]
MEFTQSSFQYFFAHFYGMFINVMSYCVTAAIFHYFLLPESEQFDIWYILIMTAGVIHYLITIYREGYKVIKLTENEFIYQDNKNIQRFSWDNFEGYKVSRMIPYDIIIKNKKYGKTKFSYFTFSLTQRRQILSLLQSKCN